MKKRLLFAFALLASSVMSAMAYDVNDFVYSKTGRYKIIGENLVKNGNFSQGTNRMENWVSVDAEKTLEETFNVNEGAGPGGSNTIQVLEGATALANGAYQVVAVPSAGTYVVTFSVINQAAAGFTDLDLTGGNTNYMNAYFQTDETPVLAYTDGTNNVNLQYGTDGVGGGYGFSYVSDVFTNVAFPVEAPSDGKIIIDFRGLASGLEIANVECHSAEKVLDRRDAQKRIDWINKILNGFEWTADYEYWEDVVSDVDALQAAIDGGTDEEVTAALENLNGDIDVFLEANCSNVLNSIPTTDGSDNSGKNSANWMNWTSHLNMLIVGGRNGSYDGKAPWTWTTDRWHHKDSEKVADRPMGIQWMRNSAGDWDNIATLTATLDKGVYFWGVEGSGGMMTLNKERWARSWANDCAATELFFNGDTTDVFVLDPVIVNQYIDKYELAEKAEITMGIRCNINIDSKNGFDVGFINPVLYKVNVKGELTVEEKAYLAAVDVQLDALKGRIEEADRLLADEAKPWGKEALKAGRDAAQKRYEDWAAMSQDDKLETYYNDKAEYTYPADPANAGNDSTYVDTSAGKALVNLVMNAGVRYLNNNFINPYNSLNAPLTEMPAAIASATNTLNTPLYNSGNKDALKKVIEDAQSLYDTQLKSAYSEEGAQSLVDKKAELLKAVDDFIASVTKDCIFDVDFSNDAVKVEAEGEEGTSYYYVPGKSGQVNILGAFAEEMQTEWTQYQFAKGFNNLYTDVLYFGKGDATASIGDDALKSNDVAIVSFDIYFGYLGKQSMGFELQDAEGNKIAGYTRTCDVAAPVNDLVMNEGKFSAIGGKNNGNVQGNICVEKNRTHFEILLNYADKTMQANTTYGTAAKFENEIQSMPEEVGTFKTIKFNSTYNNGERCCWLDNVKVEVVHDVPSGINEVNASSAAATKAVKAIEDGQLVIKTAKGTFNVAGARVK